MADKSFGLRALYRCLDDKVNRIWEMNSIIKSERFRIATAITDSADVDEVNCLLVAREVLNWVYLYTDYVVGLETDDVKYVYPAKRALEALKSVIDLTDDDWSIVIGSDEDKERVAQTMGNLRYILAREIMFPVEGIVAEYDGMVKCIVSMMVDLVYFNYGNTDRERQQLFERITNWYKNRDGDKDIEPTGRNSDIINMMTDISNKTTLEELKSEVVKIRSYITRTFEYLEDITGFVPRECLLLCREVFNWFFMFLSTDVEDMTEEEKIKSVTDTVSVLRIVLVDAEPRGLITVSSNDDEDRVVEAMGDLKDYLTRFIIVPTEGANIEYPGISNSIVDRMLDVIEIDSEYGDHVVEMTVIRDRIFDV